MICKDCLIKDRSIVELTQRVRELENKFHDLMSHPKIVAGLKGESLVIRLAEGVKAKQGASYDVILKDGSKVEVKYASCHIPNPAYPESTKRWFWHRIFGNKRMKDYKYLVLIGEKDVRFQSSYKDDSPFVFFLVDSNIIDEVVTNDSRGSIYLTTNPNSARSKRAKLLWQVRKMTEEMEEFFENVLIEDASIYGTDCRTGVVFSDTE
jgi:hypothetical protein